MIEFKNFCLHNVNIIHTSDLIAIVPPRHDSGVIVGVLSQPIVGLSIIVDDLSLTRVGIGGEHDTGTRVGVARHPCAVYSEEHEEHGEDDDHESLDVAADALLLSWLVMAQEHAWRAISLCNK